MTHAYEAEVDENGQVRLQKPLMLHRRHRAVLTVLEPLEETRMSLDTIKEQITDEANDWRQFVGTMKNSTLFNSDPVAIQKAMRDEWD